MSGAAITCAVLLHLAALHDQAGREWATPGVGLACERGAVVVAAGSMRNSQGGQSRYIVGGLYAGAWGPLRVGGVVGVIDGYRLNSGGPIPAAAGLVAVDLGEGWGLRFLAVPRTGDNAAALHLAVSRGF